MFDSTELNKLYRYCYGLTLNETTAYDLLQNALENFLKSETVKKNKFAFMYTTIRHQFIDDFRGQQKYDFNVFEEDDYVDIDVKTLESLIIDANLVEQVLHLLEPVEREILFYWAVEGYSTQQVATMLEMPKGTVLSKIYRLRQRIKQQFDDDEIVTKEVKR